VIAGCGSGAERQTSTTGEQSAHPAPASASASASASAAVVPQSHPQAIQPAAGVQAVPSSEPAAPVVGDPTAHAPSLAQVKRELKQLNLCGGVSNSADAAPIAIGRGPGFVADPGTSQSEGQLPRLTAQLDALGRALGITIYGISGYRTPAHSVAVGGFADDPHTRGEAEDVGVNSLLRSSAAQISEAELARYGLYRPFDPSDDPGNTEVNHIQLIPSGGPLTLAQSTATFDPDPSCK
jgi:hypothetical protein